MKLSRITLRIVEILKLASKKPNGIALNEICEKLDMPRTGGYDIVTTLVQTGMIHVVREQKQRYTTSFTVYRIGINYTDNLDFINTIDLVLKTFLGEVGKTIFFGTRTDGAIMYIYEFEPGNPIITTATVGAKNPVYCTSLGKVIMAFTEEEEVRRILERITFRKHTGQTLRTREEFEKELERVRKKGYTSDAGELEEHMEYVGAPIFGQDGNVMGAISVSSLYKSTEDYDALERQMQTRVAEILRLPGLLGKC